MENKKFDVKFENGNLSFGLDSNQDGQKSISGKLFLNEAIQEVIAKGTAIEGAKVVDFRFELTKMVLIIDTDKDGERLMELEIDLGESIDEATSAFKKD